MAHNDWFRGCAPAMEDAWLALGHLRHMLVGDHLFAQRSSDDQLARMLGSSRSSISKSLQELVRAGAIRQHYGAREVRDAAVLRRACDQPLNAGN